MTPVMELVLMNSKIKEWLGSVPSQIVRPGMRWYEKALNCFTFVMDCVYRLFMEFAKLVLFVIVIIISCQVFSRLVLNSSIQWSEEVALLLMVWMAFISMAIGVERKLHIAITVFFNFLPKKVKAVFEKLNTVAVVFFGFILVFFGIKLTQNGMRSTLPATKWPAGITYMIMPIAGVFILYFALMELFNLDRYRHLAIEGETQGDGKTDQQILEEMRETRKLGNRDGEGE